MTSDQLEAAFATVLIVLSGVVVLGGIVAVVADRLANRRAPTVPDSVAGGMWREERGPRRKAVQR